MKPNVNWLNDWKVGGNSQREKYLGIELLNIFEKFWKESGLNSKSNTTKRKYSNALQCLGRYLTEKGTFEENKMTALELLMNAISEEEGPLIHHDNETWQNEIDLVSRKILKYITS